MPRLIMRHRGFPLLLAAFVAMPCFAQRKVALEITHIGTDAGGLALVAELREALPAFESSLEPASGDPEGKERYGMRLTTSLSRPRIRLQLLTAGIETGAYTAVAVNVIYDSPDMPLGGAFIRGMVETCAAAEAGPCAKRILARTSRAIDWLRDRWPSLWKTL